MAFVPGDGVLQCAIVGTLHAQPIVNTLYFLREPGWSAPIVENLFGALAELVGELSAVVSDDFTWARLEATDLTSNTAPTYAQPFAPPVIGQNAIAALPGNCAFCISFRSAGRGRSSRGRNYIAGIPESLAVGNQVTGEFTSAVQAAYEGLISNAEAIGATWVIFSRYSNGVERTQGLAIPVTSVVITDANIDSQRRRLSGRGPAG